MSVGLEPRVYQDYDWGSSPMLAMNDTERKPQIMSGALVDSHSQSHNNIGQYNGNGGHVNLNVVALNGMLSSRMSHDSIIAAAAAAQQPNNPLASLLSTRGYGGGPGHHVLEGIRSSSCLFGNGHNVFTGYNGCSDSRAGLEEQRHHLLGMMSMDQKSIFHNIVKHEDLCAGDFQARIGLNLGGRTYFSTEDNIVNRLYKRARAISPGSQVPRCQAEGCKADLSNAKHYHRRHKVCELHSKAPTVVSGGISQRFCQQCSRFHVLAEFDEGKRSCRKRLADHNRRRRKPQPNTTLNASNGEAPTAAVSPVKAAEADHDTNSGSNQSNVHSDSIPRTEAQALLTGISLSPSLPLVLHNGNAKEQYLQQSSPSLSRSEMGIDYSRQTSAEKYNGLEIAIPWLKSADSGSEFGRSEKNNSPSGGQVSESGASTSPVQVFSSIQSLLPNLQSSAELGSSEWMMSGNLPAGSNNARNQQHYGSADLNLQANFEGQHMLSLQEKNVGDGRGRQNAQNAVEYLSQGGLNSKPAVDGHSEGFSGIQSFRSLGQSMYQNIL
ncbi:hypothetical protein SUGI_0601570 [Cryptomeria japonica]|nr:hypothetical protein SUGI_0601570 [Cryptomeria japonica]